MPSKISQQPDHLVARPSRIDNAVLDRWRLGFLEPEIEAGFRAAERDRNLRQARFAINLAILINLAFAASDPWIFPDHFGAMFAIRTVGLTLVLLALKGCSYLPFFRTRWPGLLALTVLAFTASFAAMNAIADPPDLYVGGFVMVVLGSYVLLPLIFMYCATTVLICTLLYLAATWAFEVMAGQQLVLLAMQMIGANIVGFTELASKCSAEQVLALLNSLFADFDRLVERHGLEKIKTIGDAYMVAGGLGTGGKVHTANMADMGIEMLELLAGYRKDTGTDIQIRIGMHTGPAVAGVVGLKKFIYDVWGETVNTASRMESHGVPNRIQVLESTTLKLAETHTFEERGVIEIKGIGPLTTYFLEGRIDNAGNGVAVAPKKKQAKA